MSLGLPTRLDTNQPSKLYTGYLVLKFLKCIETRYFLYRQGTIEVLIKLGGVYRLICVFNV